MEVVVANSRDYIEVMIDLMSVNLSESKRLTAPQRRFLVELILLYWRGIDTSKKAGVDELKGIMGWKKNSRQVYKFRSELKSKGWLRKNRGKWVVPPTFQNPFNKTLDINIKIRKNDG